MILKRLHINLVMRSDMRKFIEAIVFIIEPAVFFLIGQGLLNLLLGVLLAFSLSRDDIHAIGSCIFLPFVVYMYGSGLSFAASRRRAGLPLVCAVAVVGIALLLLGLVLIQKQEQGFLLRFLGFVISGPIIEEIIYRGFVFFRSRIYLQDWQAVLLSAILFSVGHRSFGTMTLAFFAGIFLSVALEKTKTILVPMAMHIIWNLIYLFT